jgi:hypothetical protein
MHPEATVPNTIMKMNESRAWPSVKRVPIIGELTIPAIPSVDEYQPIFMRFDV